MLQEIVQRGYEYLVASNSTYLQLHRLFRGLQRKNRSVGETSLAEKHLLIEISSTPDVQASDLTQILLLEQSYISRLIAKLEERKLLKVSPDKKDARRKKLSITKNGEECIRDIDTSANELLDSFSQNLKKSELLELADFMNTLADGYDIVKRPIRDEDHPIRVPQRRLTRAFGLLGKQFMGSSLSASQWQVLAEICEYLFPLSPKQLATQLSLDHSTISQIIRKLEKESLIIKQPHPLDARSILLLPTAQGEKLLQRIEEHASSQIESALVDLSAKQSGKFLTLLQKFLLEKETKKQETLHKLKTQKERDEARAFLATILVESGNASSLPAELLGEKTEAFAYKDEKALLAVLQFQKKGTQHNLTAAAWDPLLEESLSLQHLFEDISSHLPPKSDLKISFPPLHFLEKQYTRRKKR